MIIEMRTFIFECNKCGAAQHRTDRCQPNVAYDPELPEGWTAKNVHTAISGVYINIHLCEHCS